MKLNWLSCMSEQLEYTFFTDRDLGKQFPDMLRRAGVKVERHIDHFPDDAKDEVWLATVGEFGWYLLTHDQKIRYKRNEIAAVRKFKIGLFVIVGKAPFAELAQNFVFTLPRIERFVRKNHRPIYRKSIPSCQSQNKIKTSSRGECQNVGFF